LKDYPALSLKTPALRPGVQSPLQTTKWDPADFPKRIEDVHIQRNNCIQHTGHILHLRLKDTARLVSNLTKAQRVTKKDRVLTIYAKIKNSRKDQLRKLSTALVEEFRVVISNVNASTFENARMLKSVFDVD
jgi:hypothetical protein